MDGTPFGRYRLVELLGRGGMGEVWRAHDTDTRRTVAIKLLPASFASDPVFAERFRREAYAAAGLNDPHVVPIHHFGEIDGRLYVDMRLVEGRDLAQILAEGPLEPARAVAIIQQIAEALAAAHRVGLIHRDVKPSNVLIAENDFAYLIDFGIARAADETSLTNSGLAIGTPDYMAPERLNADLGDEDHRVDVYALACILYQCLTGQRPFQGSGFAQIATAQLFTPPPRPSERLTGLPTAMDAVIATGMAKDPNARFDTAPDLANAARRALTAELPKPPPAATDVTQPVVHEMPNAQAAAPFPHTRAVRWQDQNAPRHIPQSNPAPPPPVAANAPRKSSRRAPIVIGVAILAVVVVVAVVVATVIVLATGSTDDTARNGSSPTSTRQSDTTTADSASLLAATLQNTRDLKSVHTRMTVDGTVAGVAVRAVDGDVTAAPQSASKGTMGIVFMGQTFSDLPYVVVDGTLYAALTPNTFADLGPAGDVFDPVSILNPLRGLGSLLIGLTDTDLVGDETIDGQSTKRIEATMGPVPFHLFFTTSIYSTQVKTVVWINPETKQLVRIQMQPGDGAKVVLTQSDWDEPVVINKPPGA